MPTRTYHDIGDKKVLSKTSQALREGVANIRRQIDSDIAAGRHQPGWDTNLLGSLDVPLSPERYFEHSVRRLKSFTMLDEDDV